MLRFVFRRSRQALPSTLNSSRCSRPFHQSRSLPVARKLSRKEELADSLAVSALNTTRKRSKAGIGKEGSRPECRIELQEETDERTAAGSKSDKLLLGDTKLEDPKGEDSTEKRLYKYRKTGKSPTDLALAEALYKGYGGSARRKAIGDTKRVNIVSSNLCDDVIDRLKPSLIKHIGCDIVDINPGAGLWSSKLHEFLQPRSHILIEPDVKLYEPLLQPLLSAKDSKYTLHPKSGVVWSHLEQVLTEEHLPFQKVLEHDDPRLHQQNNTLLFVANLAYVPKKGYKGFASLALLVLHQLMTAVRAHSLFHKYGLVRMLIWVTDDERRTQLPRHVALRKKAAVEAEISCRKISEIASSTKQGGLWLRNQQIEVDGTTKVIQRMDKNGIKVPDYRKSLMHQELLSNPPLKEHAGGVVNKNRIGQAYLKELEQLENDFATGKLDRYVDNSEKGKRLRQTKVSPEWKRLTHLRGVRSAEGRRIDTLSSITTMQNEMFKLEKELFSSDGGNEELKEKFEQARDTFKSALENITSKITREGVSSAIGNERAMKDELFMYDRRDFEPLRVYEHEFYPEYELALLDFEPRTLWPILQEDYAANYDILEHIIASLMSFPGASLDEGLGRLWPGAKEWLLEDCAILTDPTQGGCLDLSLLPIRNVKMELFKGILESWLRWPWRPSRIDLLAKGHMYEGSELDESGPGSDAQGSSGM
ncbi:hypothetical protein BGZ60DRAFT_521978 [Tricladium varicosporioides]|nr:hypothetical protein BGZ60DRAFT_521978 [Hymenoscyphus varicosporioides]